MFGESLKKSGNGNSGSRAGGQCPPSGNSKAIKCYRYFLENYREKVYKIYVKQMRREIVRAGGGSENTETAGGVVEMRLSGRRKFAFFVCLVAVIAMSAGCSLPFFAEPELRLKGAEEETVALNSAYRDEGFEAAAGGRDLSGKVTVSGKVDTAARGTYAVKYKLEYRGQKLEAVRTVTVVDVTPPELKLNGAAAVTVSARSFFKDPGAAAVDNLDGDVSAGISVNETKLSDTDYVFTYTATDSDGNSSTATRTLKIKDIVKPVIVLNGGRSATVLLGAAYSDPGATASDDLDGDITGKIAVSGSIDTGRLGAQTVTYTVSDSNGNTAKAVRTVTVISKEQAAKNRIYLTFDDGPSSNITPRILDILKGNGIKATFFILDYSAADKPLVKRMLDEGHAVGIHGFTHEYSVYGSEALYLENIRKLGGKLRADFGLDTKLTRFLGGSSNAVSKKYCKGIMSRLVKSVPANGYIYYDWNVSSGDAAVPVPSAAAVKRNVLSALRPNRNNIVLMHDSATHSTTADALQAIIDAGRSGGYVFDRLTPSVPPVHHKVGN